MYWGNRSLADARATIAHYQQRMKERLAANEPLYLEIDQHLGWRLQPSCRHPRWPYTTDRLGNRRSAPDDHAASPPAYRVAIAGNSYVHCDETPDEETWVWLLRERLGRDCQVHNLGVTAYSTDQAFLRLEEFAEAAPVDAAVLTLTTTDIYRNLNMCRAFIMNDFEVPLFKPRFVPDGSDLQLKPPPPSTLDTLCDRLSDPDSVSYLRAYDNFFPTAGRQALQVLRRFHVPVKDVWQRNFPQSIDVTLRICRHFIDWCRERDIVPVLLLLPVYWGAFPAGREFDIISGQSWPAGTTIIDARQVFTPDRLQLPRATLAHRFNHFTREVSIWLADYIADCLRPAFCKSAAGA